MSLFCHKRKSFKNEDSLFLETRILKCPIRSQLKLQCISNTMHYVIYCSVTTNWFVQLSFKDRADRIIFATSGLMSDILFSTGFQLSCFILGIMPPDCECILSNPINDFDRVWSGYREHQRDCSTFTSFSFPLSETVVCMCVQPTVSLMWLISSSS